MSSDYGMWQVTSTQQQIFHINKQSNLNEDGKKYICLPTKLNACLVMLDIVLIFMLICHVYCCHRDNEQFMAHVDVNYN